MDKTNFSFHNSIIFRCEEFLRSREHIDLDVAPTQLWEHQWEQFLTEYYSIIQGGAKIQVLHSVSIIASYREELRFR